METKKETSKKKIAKTVKKPQTTKHIGLVKNDPYLEPYEDAMITMVFISFPVVGFSVNGHRMPRLSIWLEISIIGRRMKNILLNALKGRATGNFVCLKRPCIMVICLRCM